MSEAPAFATQGRLSDDDQLIFGRLRAQLTAFQRTNKLFEAYYEGTQRVRDLGISIPPHLKDIETVLGWPATALDVLEERIDLENWLTPDATDTGVEEMFRKNRLALESGMGHQDSFMSGIAFVAVGTGGGPGEPDALVTVESPNKMTCIYDPRRRQVDSALSTYTDATTNREISEFYQRGVTTTLERRNGKWIVIEKDEHGIDRVLVSRLVNRPRSSRREGRSEITRAIRGYTDMGVRTLLGMEVHREFYAAPQRYLLGADEDAFQDENGNTVPGWQAILGRMLAIGRDEETGELPSIGQFPSSSPTPFLDQVKGLAQLVAAESGVPPTYLGFVTDNPASADSIRETSARLDKRAWRRIQGFDPDWQEVGENVLLVMDNDVTLDNLPQIECKWRDVSTPTPASSADRAQKLIAAGVLDPEWEVTLEELNFSRVDIERIKRDQIKRRARLAREQVLLAAAGARQDPEARELSERSGSDSGAGAAAPVGG